MSSKRAGSGSVCSAPFCSMRRGTNLLSQVKMFKFPKDPVRREAWRNALKRKDWKPNENSLICNAHFLTGKPSSDMQHPDYIPSIFKFNEKATEDGQKKMERYERSTKRTRFNAETGISNSGNDLEKLAHMLELLFSTLKKTLREDREKPACTSEPCKWNKTSTNAEPSRVVNINFLKPKQPGPAKSIKTKTDVLPKASDAQFKTFLQNAKAAFPSSSLFAALTVKSDSDDT